jgi:hypothetical protein
MHGSRIATRREFLLNSGVFAAAALAAPTLAQAQSESDQTSAADPPEDDQITPPSTLPAGVDESTIAHAEKLAGIEFTAAERLIML